MSSDSIVLGQAAAAAKRAEDAADFAATVPPDGLYGVNLEWSWNHTHAGYPGVRAAVSALVEARMADLIKAALVNLQTDVDARKAEALGVLTAAATKVATNV